MSNDYILTPGEYDKDTYDTPVEQSDEFLKIDEALSEIARVGKQASARQNLNVMSTTEVTNIIDDLDSRLSGTEINISNLSTLTENQIAEITDRLEQYVTKDGNTAFEKIPKVNSKPLITEESVDEKLESYYDKQEVKAVVERALDILDEYVQKGDVYTKEQTYCAKKINNILNDYLRKEDLPSYHYATVGKVESVMRSHNATVDPHNFNAKLTQVLKNYPKRTEVLPKAETYSREQLDDILDKLVDQACQDLIDTHVLQTPHLDTQRVRDLIKSYAKANLVDKTDLEDALCQVNTDIENCQPIWKTSGPVLTTVGFVEDNTLLPPELTMQQILDQIFYGSKISIAAEEKVRIGEMVDVTMCLHIGLPTKSIILYMNGVPVDEFDQEEFAEGCITRPYGPITEDTIFTLKVVYGDDIEQETSTKVSVSYPLFVGIIPNMKQEHTLTMAYLKELVDNDPINNEFLDDIPLVHRYNFADAKLQKLIVGIPSAYNMELDSMSNQIQTFTREAFNFHRIGVTIAPFGEVLYDFYIYKQKLSSLNSEVTFNFVPKE